MRLEYGFELEECKVPRFAVEAVDDRLGHGLPNLDQVILHILNRLLQQTQSRLLSLETSPHERTPP